MYLFTHVPCHAAIVQPLRLIIFRLYMTLKGIKCRCISAPFVTRALQRVAKMKAPAPRTARSARAHACSAATPLTPHAIYRRKKISFSSSSSRHKWNNVIIIITSSRVKTASRQMTTIDSSSTRNYSRHFIINHVARGVRARHA